MLGIILQDCAIKNKQFQKLDVVEVLFALKEKYCIKHDHKFYQLSSDCVEKFTHSWFKTELDDVDSFFQYKEDGAFFVRIVDKKIILSLKFRNSVINLKIRNEDESFILGSDSIKFPSLNKLVNYYVRNSIEEIDDDLKLKLTIKDEQMKTFSDNLPGLKSPSRQNSMASNFEINSMTIYEVDDQIAEEILNESKEKDVLLIHKYNGPLTISTCVGNSVLHKEVQMFGNNTYILNNKKFQSLQAVVEYFKENYINMQNEPKPNTLEGTRKKPFPLPKPKNDVEENLEEKLPPVKPRSFYDNGSKDKENIYYNDSPMTREKLQEPDEDMYENPPNDDDDGYEIPAKFERIGNYVVFNMDDDDAVEYVKYKDEGKFVLHRFRGQLKITISIENGNSAVTENVQENPDHSCTFQDVEFTSLPDLLMFFESNTLDVQHEGESFYVKLSEIKQVTPQSEASFTQIKPEIKNSLTPPQMTWEQAEKILMHKEMGCYIIRGGSNNSLTLSLKQRNNIIHIKIHKNNDKYKLGDRNQEFNSLEELTTFYTINPIVTLEGDKTGEFFLRDEDNEDTYSENQKFVWLKGVMDWKDAEKLLNRRREGSFLIRKSPRDNSYTLSLKLATQAIHIKINDYHGNYILGDRKADPFATLWELVDHYKRNPIYTEINETPVRVNLIEQE